MVHTNIIATLELNYKLFRSIMTRNALQVAVFVAMSVAVVTSIPINIHVRLSDAARTEVELLALQMKDALPNDEIDFQKQFIPHATLYLTDFQEEKLQDIIDAVSKIVSSYSTPCLMTTTNWIVSGDYGMWNVNVSQCLQSLSNTVVEATHMYITPNQTIPGWVMNLPEPIRSEKIALIKQYGSPNVFDQFQPHVTMLWDHDDKNVSEATAFMNTVKPLSWYPPLLGLAQVGPYGTVLQGPEYALFNLPSA